MFRLLACTVLCAAVLPAQGSPAPKNAHFDGKGWQNEAAQAWGIQSIPATFLIDADGKIVATDLRGQQLDQKLAKLLPAKK